MLTRHKAADAPQALHATRPSPSRRQSGVVRVSQFSHCMTLMPAMPALAAVSSTGSPLRRATMAAVVGSRPL